MTTEKTKTEGSFDAELLQASAARAAEAIAKAGDKGQNLVEAWVAAKNAAAVAAVAEDERTPGPARKAARRGLNVLKARGVSIPERTHVARIGEDSIEGYDAWLVPPDASGTAIFIFGARWRSGKHRLVHAIVRDGVGLLEVRSVEMSRSQLKNWFDDTARRLGYAPSPIPLEWARARVEAAKADNPKSGAVLPLGLDSHKDLLGPAPDKAPPHPIDAASLGRPAEAVKASAALHGEPEFAPWLPDTDALQLLLSDIGQKMGAAGPEPDQVKIDAFVGGALDAATDRFFGPEVREVVARRMKDSAISILARTGVDRAAEVMSVGDAIVAAGLITSPPHEIPFLRGFFQKALAILAERSGGQLSIPIPPGANLPTEGGPPGEKASPGGISLP